MHSALCPFVATLIDGQCLGSLWCALLLSWTANVAVGWVHVAGPSTEEATKTDPRFEVASVDHQSVRRRFLNGAVQGWSFSLYSLFDFLASDDIVMETFSARPDQMTTV